MRKRLPAEILAAVKLVQSGLKENDSRVMNLVAQYVRAQAVISERVALALARGELGSLRARRRHAREVRAILHRLDEQTKPQARRIVKETHKLGVKSAQRTGMFGGGSEFGGVNREALSLLTENLEGRLGDATRTVGRRVDDVFRREGIRLSASQLASERTPDAIAESFRNRLVREGVTSFRDRAGRRWALDTYADMAIRTTVGEALATGTETVMLSRGFDLAEISRSDNPCPECKPWDGETVSLTGRSKEYEALPRPFPFHPNCAHFLFPSPLALEDREAQGA